MNRNNEKPEWYQRLRGFRQSSRRAALLQVAGSVGSYLLLWTAVLLSYNFNLPLWFTALLIIPTAFAHVRIFILFHDCCHGSLFPGRRANVLIGYVTGVLTFTSFRAWRSSHLKHHATNSQLDHRGDGDVWTMTVNEYRDSAPSTRIRYRLFRNPFIMFLLGPIYVFVIKSRFSPGGAATEVRRSTLITNLGLLAIFIVGGLAIGFLPFILMQLVVVTVSGMMGIWLFYVQHQFEPGYWAHDHDWNEVDAALRGSSFYDMPRFFQWLFGNIGIHHIHHLLPAIPNYRLKQCYRENVEVQVAKPLKFLRSLSSLRMHLWNESTGGFLSFREFRRMCGLSPA